MIGITKISQSAMSSTMGKSWSGYSGCVCKV